MESVERAVSSLVGFRLRVKGKREPDDTEPMSEVLNDSLALTLSALLVEVMADHADDPRLLPLCVLREAHPVH